MTNSRLSKVSFSSVARRLGGMATLGVLIALPVLSHAQTPAEDVAAQVRAQGYRCDRPVTAVRNARRSRPDSAVWVLRCKNAAYRVRLDPDMSARVTRLRSSARR